VFYLCAGAGLLPGKVSAVTAADCRKTYKNLSLYKSSHISEAKIKEGIFVGPQINEFIKNNAFDTAPNNSKRGAVTKFFRQSFIIHLF
jgi:hypothetical protein